MSSLVSLCIRGLRSYHPDPEYKSTQTIRFDGPVTLISGENGSGKTTIIEALKFATTGDYTKDSISDPKIWGRNKIEAEVELEFKTGDGKNILIQKLTSLNIKGNKYTSESKACNINIDANDGSSPKIRSLGSTEGKAEIPRILGVSPAILKNVIFCEQQESLWPIEDSKILKKKFQEIFGAEKYEKAKEQLKELKKNLVKEKDVYQNKSILEEKNIQTLKEIQINIENITEKIRQNEQEYVEVDNINSEYLRTIDDYDEHAKEIEDLKTLIS